jgi:ABC-type sugar transport system ATPase subunit
MALAAQTVDESTGPELVRMRGIEKTFAGVQALKGIDFDLRGGEVHALLGENGAGKSTLMSVLAGIHRPDRGSIEIAGEEVALGGPRDAGQRGIAIVHQEKNLFPELTVAENVFSGKLPGGPLGTVAARRMKRETEEQLRRFGVRIDADELIANLGSAQQQLVEIARATSSDARVIVFDEPTAALSASETAVLFREIDRLRKRGIGIVYISHRLEEVFRISDRVTVMRDGQRVATLRTEDTNVDEVIRLMVGRTLEDFYGHRESLVGDVVLEVKGLSVGGVFSDVSFEVRRGEIVGFAGLVGSGRTDVGLTLFGANRPTGGTVRLDGRRIAPRSPRHALRLGIAYASEDRRTTGLFTELSVEANVGVAQLERMSKLGFLRDGGIKRLAREMADLLNIRTPSLEQPVRLLSGGNQQKVLLAKWLGGPLRVLVIDEPTKGVDVGAKVEIYRLLRSLAADGLAIVMISSEMTEVIGMSDRVVVMHEGRVSGELEHGEIDEERIMRLASGQRPGGVDR